MGNGADAVFVLTVDGPTGARRNNTIKAMSVAGLPFAFIEGVTKDAPSLGDSYSAVLNLMLHKRQLSSSEISIYEGHRKMWQRMLDEGHSIALMLEDDAKISDYKALASAIDDLILHADRWDIVKFFDFNPKRIVAEVCCGTTRLVSYKYPASGAVAYLINKKAAKSLLSRRKLFRPIDEDLSHPWEFSLRIWSTQPNLVEEISAELGGSITEQDRRAVPRRLVRSVWGNVLQASKLINSLAYHMRIKRGS